jgi:hypothetical protein
MRKTIFIAVIFMAATLTMATPVTTGSSQVFNDGFEEPLWLKGRILLSLTMPIPEADRAAIMANAATLEAEGLIVAANGSSVRFPESSPGGWLVRFGTAEALAAADGSFVLNLAGISDQMGSIYHPSHENDLAVGTFSRNQLVADGETPSPIVFELPFDGPCNMTVGADNPTHCQVAQVASTDTDIASLFGQASNQPGNIFPLGTYPPSPRESACEILDGWIDSDTSPLGSYFGSTCFDRVIGGACPNEGGFGIFASTICCFKNHKGRFCQELTRGDMKLLDLPLDNLVILDDVTEFIVHSNANWGETMVTSWLDKDIGGKMPAQGKYFDGEAGSIKHFDADKLAAYSCKTNTPSQGADIYVADRMVTYETPRCLTKAPKENAKDQYRLQTRDGLGEFILTFRLEQSFLWQFEGDGAIFDLAQAMEFRGSRLSDPEPIAEGSGCIGKHIHGTHPCTGAPDPAPMKCGHGIVAPLGS